METYKFTNKEVKIPSHDSDVNLILPNGRVIILQFRPSNADIDTNGSLDIILPECQDMVVYENDYLENSSCVNKVKQITTELPFGE